METLSHAPLRILVADDDPAVCTLLVDQLAACGHMVVAQAATGAEAVARAAALTPDVVLLDLHMPDGLGTDAAALVARATPAPGVVLFTGDCDVLLSDAEVGSTGAVAVLPKPVPLLVLDCTVRLAAARAREVAAAQRDATAARQELEDRRTIARAKGILMRRIGGSEQDAERLLERSSETGGTSVAAVARTVLASEPGALAAR